MYGIRKVIISRRSLCAKTVAVCDRALTSDQEASDDDNSPHVHRDLGYPSSLKTLYFDSCWFRLGLPGDASFVVNEKLTRYTFL